jgi:hypothetical protein
MTISKNNKPVFLLSTAYCPPISYINKLLAGERVLIETQEHFIKQSYRNRCEIASANGKLSISIPLVKKHSSKTKITEIQIDYSENWQKNHLKAIESAYRNSPFFEFYFDEFIEFYTKKYDKLFQYNSEILSKIISILNFEVNIGYTEQYKDCYEQFEDFRNSIHPKKNNLKNDKYYSPRPYYQVFENKFGFLKNLSIFDLLFNMGNETGNYLINTINNLKNNKL